MANLLIMENLDMDWAEWNAVTTVVTRTPDSLEILALRRSIEALNLEHGIDMFHTHLYMVSLLAEHLDPANRVWEHMLTGELIRLMNIMPSTDALDDWWASNGRTTDTFKFRFRGWCIGMYKFKFRFRNLKR